MNFGETVFNYTLNIKFYIFNSELLILAKYRINWPKYKTPSRLI